MIFEGNSAIFIEVVAKRFNYIANIQRLDPKVIAQDIESIAYDKAKQLDRNIKDFRSGTLRFDGIDCAAVERIFPIIATVVPVPQFVGLTRVITKELLQRNLLSNVEPLQFLAA